MKEAKPQYIHGKVVVLDTRQEFDFTAIYGLHTVEARKSLWRDLTSWNQYQRKPWICMGDYNAITAVEDRINGSTVQENEIRDFKEFLIDTRMCEMRTVGRDYTWTNSHVFSRIDRPIINAEWINTMPHVDAVIMDPLFSDHSPLCVKIGDEQKTPKPFRFFNCLAEHKDFLDVVGEAWNKAPKTGKMAEVWRKLKEVRHALKRLNTKEFKQWI
ncbi:PREDICTED: uncharacterized protein LOC109234835 [Nicotiana attenuata]|uniref:uncharacterized protein LOC109234835 n=1 Tax=Nicotiana attenuata TaxID=49451 RepID=UPI000904D757|nr:PREDICTED: uncharacterized protein LOC109234835 [Nicotiana attenuata]